MVVIAISGVMTSVTKMMIFVSESETLNWCLQASLRRIRVFLARVMLIPQWKLLSRIEVGVYTL